MIILSIDSDFYAEQQIKQATVTDCNGKQWKKSRFVQTSLQYLELLSPNVWNEQKRNYFEFPFLFHIKIKTKQQTQSKHNSNKNKWQHFKRYEARIHSHTQTAHTHRCAG